MLTTLESLGGRRYVHNKHNKMGNYQRTLFSSSKILSSLCGILNQAQRLGSEYPELPSIQWEIHNQRNRTKRPRGSGQ